MLTGRRHVVVSLRAHFVVSLMRLRRNMMGSRSAQVGVALMKPCWLFRTSSRKPAGTSSDRMVGRGLFELEYLDYASVCESAVRQLRDVAAACRAGRDCSGDYDGRSSD